MNCSPGLLEAYMDGELDATFTASVAEHLAVCPNCVEVHACLLAQRASIKSNAPYYSAPPQLERSIRDALRLAAAKESQPSGRESPWRWLAIAATLLLAISLYWNLRPTPRRPAETELAQNLVFDHIRSLIGTHLLDVPSTDQHTVKPWFNGKLDFSPDVRDLAAQGFPLIGGRLDYASDRPVAALVYQRRQHVIDVFTWPAGPSFVEMSPYSQNGYHAISWTRGSMVFWAVSDLGLAELEQFKNLYRQ